MIKGHPINIASINRAGILNSILSGGLPEALKAKFLYLWTGKYDGNNLLSDLDSSVITVTNKTWLTKYIPPYSEIIRFGYLYNWYAANDARNICSAGFHMPTQADWETLGAFLGCTFLVDPNFFDIPNTAGGAMKETGLTYWDILNVGATNSTGFNARGSGYRLSDGTFATSGTVAQYWSSDPGPAYYYAEIGNTSANLANAFGFATYGISVRPIKDSTNLTHGQTGTYTGNDGRVYRTICIGTQEWVADNICETKYRNQDNIPEVANDAAWTALVTGGRCSFNNDEGNAIFAVPTFSVPNTAEYLSADGTDDFWFNVGNVLLQKTHAELIVSETLRTFIKYTDFEPYNISAIGILKDGEVITEADKISLNSFFKLWVQYWGTTMMDSGYMKDNRTFIE